MTSKEAYSLGWCFGAITNVAEDPFIGGDKTLACQRPYSALAKIIAEAKRRGILTGKLEQSIAEHIQNVTNFPDLDKEGSEPYLPLPLQGDWQRGYFAGLTEKI